MKIPERYKIYEIDMTRLDVELAEQSGRFMMEHDLMVDLEHDELEAEGHLELVLSQIKAEVRAHPEKYNLPTAASKGLTETAIREIAISLPRYQQAWRRYLDAKSAHSRQKGVVKTLDSRKSAVEGLVRLHGQGYFSVPRVREPESQEARERLEMERRKRERRERLNIR